MAYALLQIPLPEYFLRMLFGRYQLGLEFEDFLSDMLFQVFGFKLKLSELFCNCFMLMSQSNSLFSLVLNLFLVATAFEFLKYFPETLFTSSDEAR